MSPDAEVLAVLAAVMAEPVRFGPRRIDHPTDDQPDLAPAAVERAIEAGLVARLVSPGIPDWISLRLTPAGRAALGLPPMQPWWRQVLAKVSSNE